MEDKTSSTETNLSTTSTKPAKKVGRPARETAAPTPWSVRGVERDTRLVLEKAAERVGKTLGQYLNEDIRSFAQSQLTQTQQPASPKDMQNQIEHLTRIVEGIASRMPEQGRRTFWQRLFG